MTRHGKPGSLTTLAALSVVTAACGSSNLHTQALREDDRSLEKIEHELSMMSVSIHPRYANLQIRGVNLRQSSTGKLQVASFFNNAILRSRWVPFSEEDDGIRQILLLDLPPGSYQIEELEFALQHDSGAYTPVMQNEFSDKILLEIPENGPTYLGNLDIEVTGITVNNPPFGTRDVEFPPDKPVTLYTLTTTAGHLELRARDEFEKDLASARSRYPALETVSFGSSLIVIRQ